MHEKDGGAKNNRKPGEPLFGPSIGIVSNGPAWTCQQQQGRGTKKGTGKSVESDDDEDHKGASGSDEDNDEELTEEVVQGWVRKASEVGAAQSLSLLMLILMYFPRANSQRRHSRLS